MFRSIVRYVLPALLVAGVFPAVLLAAASPSAAAAASGTYHAITPVRALDTRKAIGVAHAAPVGPGQSIALSLAGVGQLPAAGAFSAVIVNVTVTAPTARGFIVVYPDGTAVPSTSNVNFSAGQTIANSVLTRVPADGTIRLRNGSSTGSVQIIADVRGYYTGTDAPSGRGALGTLPSPLRVLDTRAGSVVQPQQSATPVVTGNGVPADASAVVLNVTVTAPAGGGYITAYPAGRTAPVASSIDFAAGQTVPNLVVVPVGDGGRVALKNGSAGTVQLIADIFGYFTSGLPDVAGAFNPLPPARVLDTRNGNGGFSTPFPAAGTRTFSIAGRAGVPLTGVDSVIVNLTVVSPPSTGYLTIFAGGTSQPPVSNVDFAAHQTLANLAVTGVSATGTISIVNSSGSPANILVDVAGYIPKAARPVPSVTSVSRYVPNLTANPTTDAATMHTEGCADATAGSTLTLLDIGAQSTNTTPNSGDTLGPLNPGVALAETNPTVRLTYAHLVAALNGYTAGFVACSAASAKILIGTNSDGDFTSYTATAKGKDWADKVVDAMTAHSPQLTIEGADDIEAGFGNTESDAATWETSFLANTPANLVYNGSLDNCPASFGATADCGPVAGATGTWTRTDYVALTHGNGVGRISVLPQVYLDSQAVQWANIDASAGGSLTFLGALTQVGVCGAACSNDAVEGWTALYAGLATVVPAPGVPAMTDLRLP